MADKLSPQQRSRLMSRIRQKDTDLETAVRSRLHRVGYRFRKHVVGLPGRPDIVFPRERLAVFIDGDFWHGWRFPQWKGTITPFWQEKIEGNRRRDRRNFAALRRSGWYVLRIWGHEISHDPDGATARVIAAIGSLR